MTALRTRVTSPTRVGKNYCAPSIFIPVYKARVIIIGLLKPCSIAGAYAGGATGCRNTRSAEV